jgi:hypothetical protein
VTLDDTRRNSTQLDAARRNSTQLDKEPSMKISPQKVALFSLWVAFVVYSFVLSPDDHGDTAARVKALIALQGEPLSVALFNVLGLVPALYLFLLVPDGHGQRLPSWPFAVMMFALGGFALLPYLILRRPHGVSPEGPLSIPQRVFDSRVFALVLALATIGVLGAGLALGHLDAFVDEWRHVRLIHVSGIDFLLCISVLHLPLVGDDMKRRGLPPGGPLWAVRWIPLFGLLAYLVARPRLTAARPVGA